MPRLEIAWNETKQHARALLETASGQLPPATVQAAVERAQGLDLEQVIDQLLNSERRPAA